MHKDIKEEQLFIHNCETRTMSGKTPAPKIIVPASSKVAYQVSPQWAKPAVNLTSTSLEVSFDQLRYQYFQSLDGDGNNAKENAIVITLRPKLQGR